ncbi:VPS13B [Mytilus coruscus]|uniref:VPS13B n=1 Tax=Mytilus coruscus TaxID=42192 RepID=A0A6J8AYK3_MYTCO|nr:VPS13B [Mytilus coruscus]
MFKLESYISPLLMGYVDKYVKLRPEDFQLSLWGGDVVLNNLDLRLDVIEKAIHLPIVFKSVHIHELRIHVPWTKLGSEPVVITINTIECILKLRESPYEGSSKGSKSDLRRSKSRSSLKPRKQGEEDLPPGYLQSLMNKIVNNVSIIINNLIVKFVEDDIVLSLNIKSAEVYSADEKWDRDFIELSPPELVLRKSINLCDLTVCLDKCDQSGKIEHYQDPLIYRCSVTGRLYTKYDSVNAKRASVTKFDLFCEHLDVSLTDTQLPMFERLIELCMALYYGTLDPAKKDEGDDSIVHEEDNNITIVVFGGKGRSSQEGDDSIVHEEDNNITIEEESDTSSEVDQQGWSQWMWSYVPQILPENEEEGESDELQGKNHSLLLYLLGCMDIKYLSCLRLRSTSTSLTDEVPVSGNNEDETLVFSQEHGYSKTLIIRRSSACIDANDKREEHAYSMSKPPLVGNYFKKVYWTLLLKTSEQMTKNSQNQMI